MKILYLIPARAGSKGLPEKNVKFLGNKPLIVHSIDFALRNIKFGDELCISTNDEKVLTIAKEMGIEVPFIRPEELASDTATSYDTIIHAIKYYENINKYFDFVLLLQPTSPLRSQQDFDALIENCNEGIEMVVSVKKSKENPYFTLYEENERGFLSKSKRGNFMRRQDSPEVFAYNGSLYLMRVASLKKSSFTEFKKIKKIIMPEERSVDIDTLADWVLAEFYYKNYENSKDNSTNRY